ncbi:uncharacterized protein LY89DRAFT_242515 [Mollisia scopiformis]|uniref:Uncharacterized protein n=1 Tax=Mollisia scopiformis TaxID=149040 RepID=A0A194WUN7_MOLSC|nr:uncharacterized protein LY89DRAFT_242515 [Mollisia scopiformis]KUJ11327.1 hypothetical protein LY89DRAFT_242515 [Mollisia scopiformis]
MGTSIHNLLAVALSFFLFSSASTQSHDVDGTISPPTLEGQLQPSQTNTSDSLIHLYETEQCQTSPKPTCSDPNCLGPRYVNPMQYRCVATTAFQMDGRDVTLTGCRCCPIPLYVRCSKHDCRASTGTRQCASEELEGCVCQTIDDRIEAFRSREGEDMRVLAEGEVEEDIIEVNDDGLFDNERTTQTWPATVSTLLSQTTEEQERDRTGAVALPTFGLNQQPFRVMRDDIFGSFYLVYKTRCCGIKMLPRGVVWAFEN